MPRQPPRALLAEDSVRPAPPLADSALVERVRAGDEAAFELLFKTYYRALCNFLYSYLHSAETAEDVVQSVFLRVWQKRGDWAPVAGARAYLFAACRNSALDHLRHDRIVEQSVARSRSPRDPDPGSGSPPPDPDTALHASELAEAIGRAVEALPERRRAVVLLRWQHQLTNLEIARALGISEKGVEAHVSRALAGLRDRLSAFQA